MKWKTLAARIVVGTFRALLPLVILAAGTLGAITLIRNRPEVPRVEREAGPTPVQVQPVDPGPEAIRVQGFGTVQPYREVVVRPQVGGLVVEQNEDLLRGEILDEGERILRIDPRDYRYSVEQEKAAVTRAEFELKVEQGRQVVARREWSLLDDTVEKNELSDELALRKPHLAEKKAALEAAKSRLERAKLDLERTEIVSPFRALVVDESVDVGQLVEPQTRIARLVDASEFHVQVSLPAADLEWIRFPDRDGRGSPARVHRDKGDGRSIVFEGSVVQLVGDVDPVGRMARVLVSVEDPLGLDADEPLHAPLLLGEYVRVEIEGPTLESVVRVPRSAVHPGDVVWVMDREDRLAFRAIDVVFGNVESVLVRDTFEPGDALITSALGAPVPGLRLRVESPEGPAVEHATALATDAPGEPGR